MTGQFPARFVLQTVRQSGNAADVPLDTEEQRSHAQENEADREVDAEHFCAWRGTICNEETCNNENPCGACEERGANINGYADDKHWSSQQPRMASRVKGPR